MAQTRSQDSVAGAAVAFAAPSLLASGLRQDHKIGLIGCGGTGQP